jgi:hypothetical protein
VSGECQCFDEFCTHHIHRHENCRANDLVHGASGYNVQSKNFHVTAKPMLRSEGILLCTEPDGLTATPAGLTATQTSQTTAQAGQTATQPGPTARTQGGSGSSVLELERVEEDWRKPIADYLQDPSQKVDKGIRRITFKFTLINDELYRRTAEDLLLKCLDHDQAKIAMGEVHEGICGTHLSAPKMMWLLRRAGFYWPTMIADCFWYYKGCEEC